MWHQPVIVLLGSIGLTGRSPAAPPLSIRTVLSASLLVGVMSYHVIERPTGKLRARRGRNGQPRDYYPELAESANG